LLERVVEKGAVGKEPVKVEERAKEETTDKEDVKENIVMEEPAKQPPTEKRGLLPTLRELKKKISSRLLCIS